MQEYETGAPETREELEQRYRRALDAAAKQLRMYLGGSVPE